MVNEIFTENEKPPPHPPFPAAVAVWRQGCGGQAPYCGESTTSDKDAILGWRCTTVDPFVEGS